MKRVTLVAAAVLYSLPAFALLPAAYAQTLNVSTDRTIGGGNPINTDYDAINVGVDDALNNVFSIKADITDGLIANDLSIYNNSIVTFSGVNTNVSGFTYAYDDSSFTVSGGTMRYLFGFGNSIVNVTGGTQDYLYADENSSVFLSNGLVNYSVFAIGGGTAHIDGGTINGYIGSYDNGHMLINAGTISGPLYVANDSLTEMSSGSIDGDVREFNQGTFTLSGGTFTGSLALNDAATLNLIGSNWNVTQSSIYGTFDGANKYAVRDYTVTGLLQDGNSFSQSFTAGANYTTDGTKLTFGGSNSQEAPNLYLTTDSNVNGLYNGVYVGHDASDTVQASPTVSVTTGTDIGSLNTSNHSDTKVSDGDIGSLYAAGDSTVEMSGGTVAVYMVTNDNAVVTITGGEVNDYVLSGDNSQVILDGGLLNNAVHPFGNASFVLKSGIVGGSSSSLDQSTVRIEGGQFQGLLDAKGNSAVTMTDGTLDQLIVEDAAQATFFGGVIGEVDGIGGLVTISGGTFSTLTNLVTGGMTFHLVGSNFAFQNPYAASAFNVDGIAWNLTGVLADGESLDVVYFEGGGSFSGVNAVATTDGIFLPGAVAVPESGSLLLFAPALLGLAVFGFRMRRHK